jgi:hypothetical protein
LILRGLTCLSTNEEEGISLVSQAMFPNLFLIVGKCLASMGFLIDHVAVKSAMRGVVLRVEEVVWKVEVGRKNRTDRPPLHDDDKGRQLWYTELMEVTARETEAGKAMEKGKKDEGRSDNQG